MAVSCDNVRARLQEYIDRGLAPEQRHVVDAHLIECADCQRELAVLTAVVSALDHQPVSEPSPEFTGRVLAGLPRQRTSTPSPVWSLAILPVLAVAAWLFKSRAVELLERGLRAVGTDPSLPLRLSVPEVGWSKLVFLPAVGLGLTLLVVGFGVWYSRRLLQGY